MIGGIKIEKRREPDPEHIELESLFNALKGHYGTGNILKDIDTDIDIDPIVVSRWLEGQPPFSPSIRRTILNYLRERLKDLPVPVEVPKPVAVPKPEEKPEEVIQKPKPKKKRIPKEWELEGRYEGLNLYESDLLDHLKSSFGDSEFNIQDIKFLEKKARGHKGHTEMPQHLAYLKVLGYIEGPIIKNFSYYYKVK